MTLNWSPNTPGGAHREVDDILEHILSDSERRRGAATDPGTGARRFRRPAPVGIFRPSRAEASGWGDEEPSRAVADQWGGGSEEAGQPAGERSGEGLVARTKDDGIYNISGDDDGEQIDPLSRDYNGIIANYFSVGLMKGGSASILYPILIVKAGATASFMMASHAAVCLFWSYKIFFGFLSDCFPISGYKRKPYICLGWILCAAVLMRLVREGDDVHPTHLVMMLVCANMGYVWADVASDGFMVWVAHREPIKKRGKMQMLVYSVYNLGQLVVTIVILLGFSGPAMNCAGFEPDPDLPCTTNVRVTQRVDPVLYQNSPSGWCHEKCRQATFDWDLSIPEFALVICFVIAVSMPSFVRLKEERVTAEPWREFLGKFWSQIQRRACWQVILYGVISHITFGIANAAKMPANYVWLGLNSFQYQIMVIFEKILFILGLNLARKFFLNTSWRKSVLVGSFLILIFNALYFLIIYDVYRNPWFYIFTDVSALFMYTLNFLASHACMIEVASPGYEAITYGLITTATNATSPLSAVISYQLLAFFPSLNDQENIAADTPQVRSELASLQWLVMILNLSSLLSLQLLPRQKKETRELVARGEKSTLWGAYVIGSVFAILAYSSVVTLVTVRYNDVYGCMKVLGGTGCSADESSVMALFFVVVVLLYCYGTSFYLSYLPILTGERKFTWKMFV